MRKSYRAVIINTSIVLYAAMIAITFTQVFFRYVIGDPLTMSEELARYCFVWLVMLGSVVAIWQREHIRLTFLIDRFPPKLRGVVEVLTDVVASALVVVVLIIEGARITRITMAQLSPATELPIGWVYMAIPVSGVLMAVGLVGRIIEDIRNLAKGDFESSEET